MKRALLLLLALALAMTCVLAITSCGSSSRGSDDEEIYPNEDPEKAEKSLKRDGYTVVDGSSTADMFIGEGNTENLNEAISAVKGTEHIVVFYFKDSESAEAAYEYLEYYIKAYREQAKETNEGFNYSIGLYGTRAWIGTPGAIESAE